MWFVWNEQKQRSKCYTWTESGPKNVPRPNQSDVGPERSRTRTWTSPIQRWSRTWTCTNVDDHLTVVALQESLLSVRRDDCTSSSNDEYPLKDRSVTLRWDVLAVLGTGLVCHTGPISLCVDLFVFICVYFVCFCFILHMCVVLLWAQWGGPDGI